MVPIDLPRLLLYVAGVLFVAMLASHHHDLVNKLLNISKLTIIVFIVMIVCGASLYENQWHTLAASVYFTTLLTFDPPILDDSSRWNEQYIRIRLRGSPIQSLQDRIAVATFHCTVAATIPLQILRLYDRGWQVQRWPVPVILGSTYGWILGVVIGTLWALRASDDPSRPKE